MQSGLKDNLLRVQDQSIRALIKACEEANIKTFIQISASGAGADASTQFMQTKASADAALRESALPYVIFKPGLVIGANAYGGTMLMRMLASFPFVQPTVLGSAKIQCVAMSDVVAAVSAGPSRGEVAMGRDYDLVEDEAHELRAVIAAFRAWLGP